MDSSSGRGSIELVQDFINDSDALSLVEYIDHLEKTQLDDFNIYQDGLRLAYQFGEDMQYGGDADFKSSLSFDAIKDPVKRELIKKYCRGFIEKTKELYHDDQDLYISSMWLAKQYPGCVIPLHEDTDGGHNSHFVYSAVLYLNSLESGGEISFVDLDYSYAPRAGDLLVFPTSGTGDHGVLEISQNRYSIALWMTREPKMAIPL